MTPAFPCGICVIPTTDKKPDFARSSSSGIDWDSAVFKEVSKNFNKKIYF
jgi:hypothetical protein